MLQALPLWLHLIAAAVWVGSQVMMFAVVIPAVRTVDDAGARLRALETLTRRFGWLGFAALAVLVATGIENIDRYSPGRMFEIRYGYILAVKVALLGLVLLATLVHTFSIGPRQVRLQRQALTGADAAVESELWAVRRLSIAVSTLTLLLSLAILFCAALLRTVFAQRLV